MKVARPGHTCGNICTFYCNFNESICIKKKKWFELLSLSISLSRTRKFIQLSVAFVIWENSTAIVHIIYLKTTERQDGTL